MGREDFRKENINEKSFLGALYSDSLLYFAIFISFCLVCCFMFHTYAQKIDSCGSSRNSIYAIIEYLCCIHKSVYVYPTKTLNFICHLNFNFWDHNAKTNNEILFLQYAPIYDNIKRTIGIDLVYHVLKLSFRRVLTKWSHDGSQFFGSDCAIAIFIE